MSEPGTGSEFDVSGLELEADAIQERRDHGIRADGSTWSREDDPRIDKVARDSLNNIRESIGDPDLWVAVVHALRSRSDKPMSRDEADALSEAMREAL